MFLTVSKLPSPVLSLLYILYLELTMYYVRSPDDYPEEVDVTVEEDAATHELTLAPVPHTLSFDQGFFHAVRAIELVCTLQLYSLN